MEKPDEVNAGILSGNVRAIAENANAGKHTIVKLDGTPVCVIISLEDYEILKKAKEQVPPSGVDKTRQGVRKLLEGEAAASDFIARSLRHSAEDLRRTAAMADND